MRHGLIVLSDLQFGRKHRFGSPSNISSKIIFDINELSKKFRFSPEYLIIAGDITETANKKEFDDALLQIKGIATEIGIDKKMF